VSQCPIAGDTNGAYHVSRVAVGLRLTHTVSHGNKNSSGEDRERELIYDDVVQAEASAYAH